MIIVRDAQMAALGAEMRRGYKMSMLRYLAATLPQNVAGIDNEALLQRIGAAMRRAASYGFQSERNVSIFVELAFRHGDEFEMSPEFAPLLGLLRHPSGPADAKADLLWRRHQAQSEALAEPPSVTESLE